MTRDMCCIILRIQGARRQDISGLIVWYSGRRDVIVHQILVRFMVDGAAWIWRFIELMGGVLNRKWRVSERRKLQNCMIAVVVAKNMNNKYDLILFESVQRGALA